MCEKAGFALRFEHPVLAGALVGGWMNRMEDQPALPAPEVQAGGPGPMLCSGHPAPAFVTRVLRNCSVCHGRDC